MKHTFKFLLYFLFMSLSCSIPKSSTAFMYAPGKDFPYNGYAAIANSEWESKNKKIQVKFGPGEKSAALICNGRQYPIERYMYMDGVFIMESSLLGNSGFWSLLLVMKPYSKTESPFELMGDGVKDVGTFRRIK